MGEAQDFLPPIFAATLVEVYVMNYVSLCVTRTHTRARHTHTHKHTHTHTHISRCT